MLVLLQSLAGSWLGLHRPQWRPPGTHAKAASRNRRLAARNRPVGLYEGNRERTSAAVGRGAGLPVCGLWSVSGGGTSALTGSAGAPVRVARSCQYGNRPVFYAALGRSWELLGDQRVECSTGWLQEEASAAAVTGDAIFPAVWLGVLPRCPEEVRCRGGGGDELVKASRWMRDAVLTLRAPSGFSVSPSGVCLVACALGESPWKMVTFDPANPGGMASGKEEGWGAESEG